MMLETRLTADHADRINEARVCGLFYYPVKSCRGVAVAQAEVELTGLAHDREFMLVDEATRNGLTQREFPRLALVEPAIEGHLLRLAAPGIETLEMTVVQDGPSESIWLWGDEFKIVDQGELVADWFSTYLGAKCRLTRMSPTFVRRLSPQFARRDCDRVSFADGFPILLLSEESLADLNTRLDESLPMNRFRPNIVITGHDLPYGEDRLDRMRIGQVEFDVITHCARCAITTIHQETTERSKEPLKTLAAYRREGKNVMFGQNVVPITLGTLHVGDSIEVLAGK